ncbi:mechanosensitive ion channel [Oxalobacteraceae bacterium R-40]|uniref:Mechanosensitive ion channel n=1 Tax=Keguizhuia sedimenti TaxID=3064264 RepID=A0ABU1BNB9_9BURK|nr:mechanosensitive ion channel [Oxalobacteraceae bacterium R-40]
MSLKSLVHIVVVWLSAWVILMFIRNFLNIFRRQVINRIGKSADFRRVDTLVGVGRHAALFVIIGIAFMLSLGEMGISIAPVLATAGVAGVAVGFGAQSLVRDFFSGLFLLIENQVSEGEFIEAAGKSGHVEEVTLRHIRIRDDDGSVHFIPNGIITTVTNKSRDYGYAVVDVNVARHYDPDRVFDMMRRVYEDMRQDSAFANDIMGNIEIAGVEKIEDALITLRCKLKVRPLKQAGVRREFLRRMKAVIDSPDPAGAGRDASDQIMPG